MYLYDKNRITYFAETDRRNKRVPFGIKADDRTRHMYIIGKTGMGKSTCIENMVVQDIKNGEGFAFIDPHGKSAALLLDYIPEDRIKDVVYFAPFDTDNPISFNVLEDVGPDKRHLVANGLMSAFKKIWGPETFSARMEYILMNALLALLEYPDSTLLGVSRILTDKVYRKKVVDNVKDPSVKAYWVDEFAKYSENYAKDAVPGIQNKLGQFTSNPLIRNIIGQPHSSFDLRKMMDERKILIVNLSKGQLGEGNANLLGGMIITKIYLAAMSRADLTEDELKRLPNFYMYVDEFQSFANESFADILSEARKYKLALVVAHQYIKQMDEKVADAVFGNVGTQIMFRVGAPDAEVLEKEYAPVFTAEDMVSLGFTQIYLKLMIDGVASHPFSAVTLGPIAPPAKSLREEVIASSRAMYGRPREKIEKDIAEWFAGANAEQPSGLATGDKTPARSEYQSRETSFTTKVPVERRDSFAVPPRGVNAGMISRREEGTRGSSVGSGTAQVRKEPPGSTMDQRNDIGQVGQNTETQTQRGVGEKTFRSEKVEKPFAQAFKNLQKPEPKLKDDFSKTKENIQSIGLSALSNKAPGVQGAFVPQKTKSVTPGSLSGLKAALADVLETEKKNPQKPTPVAPLQQQTQKTQKQNEESKVETSVSTVTQKKEVEKEITQEVRNKETSVNKNFKEINTEKQVPSEQVREVPEDVLTAILQGDD